MAKEITENDNLPELPAPLPTPMQAFQEQQSENEHNHDGVNSPFISPNPKNSVPLLVTSTIPTYTALEGTQVLYFNSGTYRIYFRLNKAWHYATLT